MYIVITTWDVKYGDHAVDDDDDDDDSGGGRGYCYNDDNKVYSYESEKLFVVFNSH